MAELYKLPNGWEWKKLEKLIKLQNGFAFKSNLFVDSGLPIVRIKNIKNEIVLLDDVVYFNKNDYEKKLDSYQIKRNDILIAMSGATTGKIGLYESDEVSYLNQRVGLFRIEDSNLRSYLFYFLSTQIAKNLEQSLGAAQPNLSTQQINDIEIPLPPLEEQKRIVSKLDKLFASIDKAIALHQKNIDEANVFMASVLNEVFVELEEKYGKRTIESFSKVGTGVTPLKNRNDFYENGNINWITSKATNDNFVYESEQLITEIAMNECRLRINPIGTIIVALYGQGKTRGQVSELMIESTTNQALATIIVDKNQSINTYLKYFLKKSYFDIREKASGGTQPNLNLSIIKSIELPLPPLQTQQKVVTYLDEISQKLEKIKQLQKEKMAHLKALKASILDSAFRGEL